MLCFEGIQLMLNIFRGKKRPPVYRTVPPPNGKLEILTAHKEVSCNENRPKLSMALMMMIVDNEDTAVYLGGYFAKYQIYKSTI